MTSSIPATEYRFSGYRLDVNARKLLDPGGRPLQLSSRAFDTLVELIRRPGDTLSKDDLMTAVWPDVVVEQNNLNQAISSLRKCLADSTSAPRFIQTIPGRGYRFIAPVEAVGDGRDGGPHGSTEARIESDAPEGSTGREAQSANRRIARSLPWRLPTVAALLLLTAAFLFQRDQVTGEPAPPAAAASLVPLPNSLAVMPLTELNEPTDDGLFAIGLHDEMIHQMARIRSLKVVSRENVLALAGRALPLDEMGRLLRAETILSGTIFYRGDRARIRLQMLAPASGIVLWGSSYEVDMGKMADILALQADIATNVADALEAEITARERDSMGLPPTDSFEAYRYLLAAKNAYYFQNYEQTFDLARQAIARDEGFIDAHYYFSYVNLVLTAVPLAGMTADDHLRLAMESAERIVALAPGDSRGYSLRGAAYATRGDWGSVTEEVERLTGMGVSPSEMKFYAPVLMSLGDFDGAIEILEANLLSEPVNLYGRGFLMAAYEMAGRPDRARREYALGEELNPVWWGDTVNIFLALGRNEPLRDIDQLPIPEPLKALLANLDDRERVAHALAAYRNRREKVSAEAVYYAAIAAHAGEHELAVELMRDALDDVWLSLHWVWLPVFDEIRRLASFHDLLVDAGVVAHWDRHGWPAVCARERAAGGFRCEWRAK